LKHILVTGSHRSGTTWTGNMIALSDQVHYISEIFNPERDPGRCLVSFPKWFTHLPLDAGEPYYSALRDTIVGHKYHILRGLQSTRSPGEYKAKIAEYLKNLTASRRPNLRSLLKDPIAIFSAEWLAESFDMDVVVLIRHPANFVSSLKLHQFNFPFEDLGSQERLMVDFLEPFREEINSPPVPIINQAILLWRIIYSVVNIYRERYPEWNYFRYEDLALNPIPGFKQLFNNLKLEWSSEIELKLRRYSNTENPTETDNPMNIYRNSQAMVSQWKQRLSDQEINLIKDSTSDVWPLFYKDSDW